LYCCTPGLQGQVLHYDSSFRLVPANLCVGSQDLTLSTEYLLEVNVLPLTFEFGITDSNPISQ